METVVKIRRYRTVESAGSQFVTGNATKNITFAQRDLKASGLDIEDIEGDAPAMLKLMEGAIAGYRIPYFHHLTGVPLMDANRELTMWRTKYEYPKDIAGPKYPKYMGPHSDSLLKHGLPSSIPYVPPAIHSMSSKELICAEGEKKTASIIKLLRIPAFGIGGCQMWRDPDKSGRVHPWILELLRSRGVESVLIVPDGDIQRYDIASAYGTFARALEAAGEFRVEILNPPGKIDDLLVGWKGERDANWTQLPKLGPLDLVQSARSLINDYGLSFKSDAKGNPTVHQNTSNLTRLLENHPAFPRIWLNEDNNTIMLNDVEFEPVKTDMDLANYFQYNLGFYGVTDRLVHNCVDSTARGRRLSPFLDWIRQQEWDGVPRLHDWLNTYWGVENTDHVREIASKWLVGACARLDKPGTKIDWMFIVIGPQGTGKSTMPEIVFKGNSNPIYGDQDHKDLHILMHSTLCTIFDELDSFTKKDASTLKAMVTTHVDRFRPPYGMVSERFPRRFTLYGCGNRHEFIQHDSSGYRRYAVVEVAQLLDFKRLEADIPQLWAEAWHRYSNDKLEFWKIENASAEAEKFVVPNLIEEKVINWVETEKFTRHGNMVKDGMLWFSMSTLMQAIQMGGDIKNSNVTREIASILKKMGAKPINSSGPHGRGRGYTISLD